MSAVSVGGEENLDADPFPLARTTSDAPSASASSSGHGSFHSVDLAGPAERTTERKNGARSKGTASTRGESKRNRRASGADGGAGAAASAHRAADRAHLQQHQRALVDSQEALAHHARLFILLGVVH